MGQTWRRREEDQSPDTGPRSGQRLWLESCVDCKQPLTIVAASRPVDPRCDKCASAAPAG